MRRLPLALAAASALGLAGVVAPGAGAATVSYSCSPAPDDCTGWYREPVRLTWSVPPEYDTEGCDNRTYDTDTTGTENRCRASNGSAVVDTTVTIHVDRTPPVLTGAAPARPADRDGWWTKPVEVRFAGTDATSGIAACTDVTYRGPDGAAAAIAGTCTDGAGNVSTPLTFPLRYDASPPVVGKVRCAGGDRRVGLRWTASADAVRMVVRRGTRTVYRGTAHHFTDTRVVNGRRYAYRVAAVDAAGNVGVREITVIPRPRLVAPGRRARTGTRPLLRWTPVRGARYYNVQLYRGGRKVLTAWPRSARYRPPALHRGASYTWYVWPGLGQPVERRYGKLIGRRGFRVR